MQGISFCEYVDKIVFNNKISHAFLFEINDYNDDYLEVLKFVKMLFCESEMSFNSIELCSKCNICKNIDSGNYADFNIIEPDGKEIKKKQLLWIRSEYSNKSLTGSKRIYLIKYAEKMNLSAANAMLKFLEEPEDNIIAILLTTNKYKMLETIVSRCQYFKFPTKSEYLDYDENFKLLEFMKFIKNRDLFVEYNYICDTILVDRNGFINFIKTLQLCILSFMKNKNNVMSDLDTLLKEFSTDELSSYIFVFEEVLSRLQYNVNYKLIIDYMFSKLIGGDSND